jgi:7-cyano-7-deazaguanine reductase
MVNFVESRYDLRKVTMTTQPSDLQNLTILGKDAKPSKKLEAFPNHTPGRYYLVTLETSEFTCVCPMTGQPDFATIRVAYVPDQKIVESKSFKLYLWSYRDEGAFHEHVVNQMLDDLVAVLDPHWIKVSGIFNPRGGIGIKVEAEHVKTPAAKQAVA